MAFNRTEEEALGYYNNWGVRSTGKCVDCQSGIPIPDEPGWEEKHRQLFINKIINGISSTEILDFKAHMCPPCYRRLEICFMSYQDYLQTPEWQAIRLLKLKQANYHCELCYADGVLHVHHKTYHHHGNEELNELIVLCANCHAKFHDKLPKEPGQ